MNFESYLFGSFAIMGFIAVSIAGALLVRRIKNIDRLTRHHEVMGFFFPVVASIYGILLGMIVVNSIDLFDRARDTVNKESNLLVSVFMMAEALPNEARERVRTLCRDYAHAVIDLEWETMDGGTAHPLARSQALSLFEEALKASKIGTAATSKLLDGVHDLWQERRDRLDRSNRTIPGIEWFALRHPVLLHVRTRQPPCATGCHHGDFTHDFPQPFFGGHVCASTFRGPPGQQPTLYLRPPCIRYGGSK